MKAEEFLEKYDNKSKFSEDELARLADKEYNDGGIIDDNIIPLIILQIDKRYFYLKICDKKESIKISQPKEVFFK